MKEVEARSAREGDRTQEWRQAAPTDPGLRIMKTADGFEQACNAQAAVDNGRHLIVTARGDFARHHPRKKVLFAHYSSNCSNIHVQFT